MKMRKRVLMAGTLAASLLISLALARRPPDPIVEGKPVSGWATDLLSPDHTMRWEAQRVLVAAGRTAVPQIREVLLTRSSPAWQPYLESFATFLPFLAAPKIDPALCRLRGAEIISLLDFKAVEAAPDLVDSLGYSQADAEAERALSRMGDPAVPAIIEGLRSGKPKVRMLSARLLRDSAARHPASAAALVRALGDSQPGVRKEAALSLSNAARHSKDVAVALLGATFDPAAEVRSASFEALGCARDAGPEIIDRLKSGLQDSIPLVRLEAAKTYSALTHDSQTAIKVLSSVLATQEGWQAAYALAGFGPEAAFAIPDLIEVLKREKVPRAFRTPPSSAFALGQIQEAAIPALRPVLSHPEPAVRIAAVLAFGFMGDHARSAVPSLIPLLRDPEPEIRQVTAITLAGAGAAREVVLPGLMDCLRAEDIYVRSTAAALLRKLAPEQEWAAASE